MRRFIFVAAALVFSVTAHAEPNPGYQPLAFLAGHCWKGTFPDGKQTDEHCFSWIYDGRFLRDMHTLRADGRPDYLGETVYFWDPEKKRVEYLYIENQGGFSRGIMSSEGGTLVFPQTEYVEDGKPMFYRSRWQPAGPLAYDVLTEFKSKEGWVMGFKVHMEQIPTK